MTKLLKKLLETGRNYECEICHIKDWNNKDLCLHVHHIDGNPQNNDVSNLQLLCPNCHSQTENWCAKNIKREKQKIQCSNCGAIISNKNITGLCKKCYYEQNSSHIPSKEQLIQDMLTYKSYSKISTQYNVSETTIRKWVKKYNIDIKNYVSNALLGIKPIEDAYNQLRKLYGTKVAQYSVDNELIAQYSSIGEAAKITNTAKSCIRAVLKNKRKTANGFIWKII